MAKPDPASADKPVPDPVSTSDKPVDLWDLAKANYTFVASVFGLVATIVAAIFGFLYLKTSVENNEKLVQTHATEIHKHTRELGGLNAEVANTKRDARDLADDVRLLRNTNLPELQERFFKIKAEAHQLESAVVALSGLKNKDQLTLLTDVLKLLEDNKKGAETIQQLLSLEKQVREMAQGRASVFALKEDDIAPEFTKTDNAKELGLTVTITSKQKSKAIVLFSAGGIAFHAWDWGNKKGGKPNREVFFYLFQNGQEKSKTGVLVPQDSIQSVTMAFLADLREGSNVFQVKCRAFPHADETKGTILSMSWQKAQRILMVVDVGPSGGS